MYYRCFQIREFIKFMFVHRKEYFMSRSGMYQNRDNKIKNTK